MNERHSRARTPEIERRLGRRVAAADDDCVLEKSFVSLTVDVRYVREIFARHTNAVRRTEISRGDDDRPCFRPPLLTRARPRHDNEVSGAPLYGGDPLALAHRYPEVQDGGAIIGKRVAPARLFGGDYERQSANRQLLGGRKESHVGRVRGDRADHDFRVQHKRPEPRVLRGDGGGEAAWPRTHDHDISIVHDRRDRFSRRRRRGELEPRPPRQ